MEFKFLKLTFLGLMLSIGSTANAGLITLETGTNGGAVLAAGTIDTEWQINTGSGFVDAVVLYPIQICCGMSSIPSGAWLSDPSITEQSDATGWGVGNNVTLKTTFDLSSMDSASAVLSGMWRVADHTIGIYLNGVLIPNTTFNSTWSSDYTLPSVTSGFNAGINTLEIIGQSGNSRWDGFWFAGSVRANDLQTNDVSEPSTFIILSLGIIGLLSRRFKRTN